MIFNLNQYTRALLSSTDNKAEVTFWIKDRHLFLGTGTTLNLTSNSVVPNRELSQGTGKVLGVPLIIELTPF